MFTEFLLTCYVAIKFLSFIEIANIYLSIIFRYIRRWNIGIC